MLVSREVGYNVKTLLFTENALKDWISKVEGVAAELIGHEQPLGGAHIAHQLCQPVFVEVHDHHLPRKREGRTVLIDREVWNKARQLPISATDAKTANAKQLQLQCQEARKMGYVTISDAARHFGIHRGHLYYYAKKHKFKTIKIGCQVFYDKKQLYQTLKEDYVGYQSNP